jgi:hypothetical protein
MKPEIKAQWTMALRSGEYKQGRGHLGQAYGDGETRYCCLGVLCDLAVKAGVDVPVETGPRGELIYDGEFLVPPKQVQEWAGLVDFNPTVKEVGRVNGETAYVSLAQLNDGARQHRVQPHSFEDIAQIIEERL